MSRPEPKLRADAPQTTTERSDGARWKEVRDEAAALRAESRQARRQAAEVRGDRNVLLDTVVLLAASTLRQHGFRLTGPPAARFRTSEGGSTGVEITVRLQDPRHANAAQAALL